MPGSSNPIFTPESSPTLQKARREGKRVTDLRDDGKWHDISTAAGKGDDRRPPSVSKGEFERRWEKTFGCAGDGTQDGGS